jgi:hypothetical protein
MRRARSLVLAFGWLAVAWGAFGGLAAAQGTGDFSVELATDPFDDSNRSFILNVDPIDFHDGDNLAFGAKCLEDGLNILVIWGKYFAGDDEGRVAVRHRIDDQAAGPEEMWEMFAGQEMAWMPMHLVGEFVAAARAGRRILIRVVDPFDGETITNEFELVGFGPALDQILPCD